MHSVFVIQAVKLERAGDLNKPSGYQYLTRYFPLFSTFSLGGTLITSK